MFYLKLKSWSLIVTPYNTLVNISKEKSQNVGFGFVRRGIS